MFRTLFTRLQQRSNTLVFPFNFEGLAINEETLINRYLPMNQRCRQSMSKIFEDDMGDGFRFAFHNVLAAIEQNDLTFLKEVAEPKLFSELQESLHLLSNKDLHVTAENRDISDLSLKYTSFSFVFGVHHDRQMNRHKEDYEISTLKNLKSGIDLRFFKPGFEAPLPNAIMRIGCLLSCPNGVYLTDNKGQVLRGQSSTTYHKVIFEGFSEGEAIFQDIREAQRALWKTMGNAETEEKYQMIRDLFRTEQMTWKVVDIDGHMTGNPYTL